MSAGGGATTGTFAISSRQRRAVRRPRSRARARRSRDRLAGQDGPARARLPRRRRQDARTYPVVDGVRYAVPGDRARLLDGGVVELHGRDSVTINSGGEKIFAEEVEAAIKAHPGVYDCVVAGRPSERWGNEVVAVVRIRDGPRGRRRSRCCAAAERAHRPLQAAQGDSCSSTRSCARRSGKADYRWAKQVAAEPVA